MSVDRTARRFSAGSAVDQRVPLRPAAAGSFVPVVARRGRIAAGAAQG